MSIWRVSLESCFPLPPPSSDAEMGNPDDWQAEGADRNRNREEKRLDYMEPTKESQGPSESGLGRVIAETPGGVWRGCGAWLNPLPPSRSETGID